MPYEEALGVTPAGRAGKATRAAALMPASPEDRSILRKRAESLAAAQTGPSARSDLFLQFRLGPRESYGIPFAFVEEVMRVSQVARVPGAPGFIAGVVNRRGALLPVLDLKHFFRTGEGAAAESVELIVVSGGGLTVGVLADEVEGDGDYDPAALASALPSDGVANLQYVRGIHDGKVTILDMEQLLADPALVVEQKGCGAAETKRE